MDIVSGTIAYNRLYSLDLAGYITAFDIKTGKRLWHFFSGDSGLETHYGDYAFYWGPLVADRVVFAATGDHSPNQPLSRGQKLFAVDADTGTHLWNITGMMAVQAIADGYLLAYNAYDNRLYCFGKGQTTVAVSVTKSQIEKGESVGITGTVTDQSPSQKGSPCISKDNMGTWMEYLAYATGSTRKYHWHSSEVASSAVRRHGRNFRPGKKRRRRRFSLSVDTAGSRSVQD